MKDPLTGFLCDLVRCQTGALSMVEVRRRWAQGMYEGVKPHWAATYVKLFSLGRIE